jgi:hypothetical protein
MPDLTWKEAPYDIDAQWLITGEGQIVGKVGSMRLGGGAPYFVEYPLGKRLGEWASLNDARLKCHSLAKGAQDAIDRARSLEGGGGA